MNYFLDTETQGLGGKLILACLMDEKGEYVLFTNKDKLYNHIIKLGTSAYKRQKTINIYAHNHHYDFYRYIDINKRNFCIKKVRPFITTIKIEEKECIYLLDSYGVFGMSLKELGDLINLPKMDIDEGLQTGTYDEKEWIKLVPYITRDCHIVRVAMKRIKYRMNQENIYPKKMYTISQLAISYLMKKLREDTECKDYFIDQERGLIYWTKFSKDIHKAYRGGRVDCFKYGEIPQATGIDINNLYGYATIMMRFPDLKSEAKVYQPLKSIELGNLLNIIGVSKVMIENVSDAYSFLPVRQTMKNGRMKNIHPRIGSTIIGVYTHAELQYALLNGWTIKDIEWSIIWHDGYNPFLKITPELYKRRFDGDQFERWFYKRMQNDSYGKLAYRGIENDITIRDVEDYDEMIENGYKTIGTTDDGYIYSKEMKTEEPKPYYNPIIPTCINAYGRMIHDSHLRKIPRNKLLYCDTDSIYFEGTIPTDIPIGRNIGQFKLTNLNVPMKIYGKKTYVIGTHINISGVNKKELHYDDFMKGEVEYSKMIGLKQAKIPEEAGTFTKEKRNLHEEMQRHIEEELDISEHQKLYIDEMTHDIDYFTSTLTQIYGTTR